MFELDHYQVAEPKANDHHPLCLPPDVVSTLQLCTAHKSAITFNVSIGGIELTKGCDHCKDAQLITYLDL